jgi:hypothetical protein
VDILKALEDGGIWEGGAVDDETEERRLLGQLARGEKEACGPGTTLSAVIFEGCVHDRLAEKGYVKLVGEHVEWVLIVDVFDFGYKIIEFIVHFVERIEVSLLI